MPLCNDLELTPVPLLQSQTEVLSSNIFVRTGNLDTEAPDSCTKRGESVPDYSKGLGLELSW